MVPLTTVNGRQYIGIDLGTTFSAMAYLSDKGQPVTITNAEGDPTTPSVVLFKPDGSVKIGHEARLAALGEPERVAECVKRDIGESHYHRPINGKNLAPEAISALILKKLRQDAEKILGPVHGAVVTVTAYFDERRRQATIVAGQLAGLDVLDIINEPTAAALAYALRDFILKGGNASEELRLVDDAIPEHNALIYDLGGGTFDVTLLNIVGRKISVIATDGDVMLGGKDWDERIVDFAAAAFEDQFSIDPRRDPKVAQNLWLSAEQAKHALSRQDKSRVNIACDGKSLAVDLSRAKFDELTADLLYRTENRLARVIKAAKLSWDQINQVLTVGGSTRMPHVLAMLERVTGSKPNNSLSPDEVVAHGAAVHAAILLAQSQTAPRKRAASQPPASVPRSVARAEAEATPMIQDWDAIEAAGKSSDQPGDTSISEKVDMLSDEDVPLLIDDESPGGRTGPPPTAATTRDAGDTVVDLDADAAELTAAGEQVPGDANEMTQVLSAIQTSNVNAHSLGVAVKRDDGVMINSPIIPRNSPLPTSVTKRYGTSVPNQTSVSVHVLEGESSLATECINVGTCRIAQLPWGLRKGSTIYVTFSYDNSGRLAVKAVEATSGKSAVATVERENAMNEQQVAKVKQAVTRIEVT